MNTWRDVSRRCIQAVVDKVGLEDKKRLKRALSDAYPFGERAHYPYKVWRQEVKKVLNPTLRPVPKENLFGLS